MVGFSTRLRRTIEKRREAGLGGCPRKVPGYLPSKEQTVPALQEGTYLPSGNSSDGRGHWEGVKQQDGRWKEVHISAEASSAFSRILGHSEVVSHHGPGVMLW